MMTMIVIIAILITIILGNSAAVSENILGYSSVLAQVTETSNGLIEATAANAGHHSTLHNSIGRLYIGLQFFGAIDNSPAACEHRKAAAIAKKTEAIWAPVMAQAELDYRRNPSDDNKKILVSFRGEKYVNKIDAEMASIKEISALVGYDVTAKAEAINKSYSVEKAEWVLSHGSANQIIAANDYLKEVEIRSNTAAAETQAETAAFLEAAGIEKEFLFSSKENKNSNLPYAVKLLEAIYVKAMVAGNSDVANQALRAALKEAKTKGLCLDTEITKIIAGKPAIDFLDCVNPFYTIEISLPRGEKRVSLTKTAADTSTFKKWLNGHKEGYTETIASPYGEMVVTRPQTKGEAAQISAIRAMGLAAILANKLVEVKKIEDRKVLKRGIRRVDINNSLVGYFGDPTGEFAKEGAARAGALSDILDEELACKKTIREFLVELKQLREDRAADRKAAMAAYRALSGETSAEHELDKAYQAAQTACYGEADLDEEVTEAQFVKWATEKTDKTQMMIWDFVQIIRGAERLEIIETNLRKELGFNVNIKQWAVKHCPAIWDMWKSQSELADQLGYQHHQGDELGLATAITNSFKMAQKMSSASGAEWLQMYARVTEHFTLWDVLQELSRNNNHLFKMVESVLTKEHDDLYPTKGMVKSMCEHKLPGVWKPCAAFNEIIWSGDFGSSDSEIYSLGGFSVESVSDKAAFGCSKFETERKVIEERIMSGSNLIKWYGRLIISEAGEYAPEITIECIQEWMRGLEEGLKPWESYPKAGLIPGNPRFNAAAKSQFGTAATVITEEDVETFDRYLRATVETEDGGSPYLRSILEFSWGDTQEDVEKARALEKELAQG